jgi:hypothetical protein
MGSGSAPPLLVPKPLECVPRLLLLAEPRPANGPAFAGAAAIVRAMYQRTSRKMPTGKEATYRASTSQAKAAATTCGPS